MSLDVYLHGDTKHKKTGSGIFVREGGKTIEISEEEWNKRNPGRRPVRFTGDSETDIVYHDNITHNLAIMARSADIFEPLWAPSELGITKAEQLIEPLEAGLIKLCENPEQFRALNPDNGWGDYAGLVQFVSDYLTACQKNKSARVEVSR